jgi:type IV pilus assembly protein PilW
MSTERRKVWVRGGQQGFTLIEILIALLIGVFLLAALLTIVQANRRVYGDQTQLAQLQDSERMALTLMTDVIQMAGYFPNPTGNTSGGSLPATAPFQTAGQAIFGQFSSTAPGDTISVRYMTAGSDGILNCSGLSNINPPPPVGSNTGNILYINTFSVVNGQLVCALTTVPASPAAQYNLVSGVINNSTDSPTTNVGVVNLSILYGVNTTGAGNAVDTYFNASQMAALNWPNVISVLIELTFTNPLYTNGSTTQPKTIEIQRVVGVMNQLGPVN